MTTTQTHITENTNVYDQCSRFSTIVNLTRQYFVMEYHAGTREMIARYICSKIGDVSNVEVSAALRILKEDAVIVYEKRVWWFLGDC